uniref:Secreted protein n=1 Tax=Steinernema glaseri TaxID=37863 RepID=A0A1I7XZD7_9BILA
MCAFPLLHHRLVVAVVVTLQRSSIIQINSSRYRGALISRAISPTADVRPFPKCNRFNARIYTTQSLP